MPLIAEELSVWDISFRWAGYDPTQFWFRLPLAVKDNSRLLMNAILHGEIICETMTLAKLPPASKADPKYYIRTYIDDIYACIHGARYDRKLLKWASLGRMDFYEWCARRGIPLPEFWFPPGWKLDFEMPELDKYAMWAVHIEPENKGEYAIRYDYPKIEEEGIIQSKDENSSDSNSNSNSSDLNQTIENDQVLRINQRARVACQQIASEIWKNDQSRTIASIVQDEIIQKYGGAAYYEDDTVREWIKEIAPAEVKNRRGRPRKNRDE